MDISDILCNLTLENIPDFVHEDIKELSYEYFCRLQWIGQDYPHPHIITDYKYHIEHNTCVQIYNYLTKYGKVKLYDCITNIQNNIDHEENIIDQLMDEYIERFNMK